MEDNEAYSIKERMRLTLMDIWPSIYRTLNSLLWGFIGFLKDLVSGLWR